MNSNRNGRTHYASFAVIAAGALILGLGLPGCTPNKAESSPKTPQEQVPVSATVAWKSEEVLVSDVKVLGEVAIAYRRQGPQMEVIARNLNNGKQLWKDEALGAADSRGIDPTIEIAKYKGRNYVAYTGTKTGAYGRLKIADVATGKPVRIENNFDFWGFRPFVCGKTFCAEGAKVRDGQLLGHHHFKFDWTRKRWNEVPKGELEFGLQQGGRRLTDGVISYWNGDLEMLSYSKGSKTLWKRPYEKIFGKGYESSAGWAWVTVGDDKEILLGYGKHAQDDFFETDKKKAEYQLVGLSKIVAIDANSGEVLWRQPGISRLCGVVSPQGSAAKDDTIVVCYYNSGKQILTDEGEGRYSAHSKGATWSAAAIDTKTGTKKWSHKLTDIYKYFDRLEGAGIPVTEEPMSILPLEGGDQAVNSEDGTVVPLEEVVGGTVLCTVDRDSYYIYSVTLGTQATWDTKASGDTRFTDAQAVCKRGSWKPTEAIPKVAEFRRAGYIDDEVVVLSQLGGMVAYRLTDASGD